VTFTPAAPALARIAPDHATALKATHEAGRRGGDSIARKRCLDHFKLFASRPSRRFIKAFKHPRSFRTQRVSGALRALQRYAFK